MQPIAKEVEFVSNVTIYTLAEELNMTPSMISRAFSLNGKISEEKRKIILETANKYGFTPKSNNLEIALEASFVCKVAKTK